MKKKGHIFDEIRQAVDAAERVLVVGHLRPDGDAMGAMCAMLGYLDVLGKQAQARSVQIGENFRFLPNADRILEWEDAGLPDCDLVIVLDTSDANRTAVPEMLEHTRDKGVRIINIDHHHSNSRFGHVNFIDAEASSTSEILFGFFRHVGFEISNGMASALLTGLITDTSAFSNAATTKSSVDAASSLLACGARMPRVIRHTYQNKPVKALRLWGLALSRLVQDEESGVAATVITRQDLEQYGADAESLEGLANFLNSLEARIVFLLKEHEPGKIKVSMRSTFDGIDVSRIANAFGGGGHKKAAGFTVSGSIMQQGNRWTVV